MPALLLWLIPSAFAAPSLALPTKGGCPPSGRPCLGLLDADFEIFPPDKMREIADKLSPEPLRWLEVTVRVFAGEVELTVQDVLLDPRDGIVDERQGTISWVVPIRDPMNVGVEVRNPSRELIAEYEVTGEVLVVPR